MVKSKKIAVLILAAGESKRLGKPKQNLIFNGRTMLNHIKERLTLNFVDRTFIVLGAYADEIIENSKLKASEYFVFKGWKEGMGSSLAFACSKIFVENDYDGILITLSDLPLVTNFDYQKMIEMFELEDDIIATKSKDSMGVPAIFGKAYFSQLLKVKGAQAAKPIIYKYLDKVKVFENERAGVDVDKLEDFENLKQ